MKGPIGVAWANNISIPRRRRIIIMGIIHQIRSFQRKDNNSEAIENLENILLNMKVTEY
jgi:hypothetical protein